MVELSSAQPSKAGQSDQRQPLVALVGRSLTRDSSVYVIGLASVFPLSLASALVSTAFLEPHAFGRLAVLVTFASLLTIVYGLGLIQGVLLWAYGMADDDDGGGETVGDGTPTLGRAERARAMGSGLLLASAVAVAGSTLAFALSAPISRALLGSTGYAGDVRWAASSAAAGALWRLVVQTFRMERQTARWLLVHISRPTLALGLTWVFLARGDGVTGVLMSLFYGTIASLALGLAISFRSYTFRPRATDFREMSTRGLQYAPIVASVWVMHNVDILIVSHFATPDQTGLYRLASRIGSFPMYVTGAILMSWAPLQHSSAFRSANRTAEHGDISTTVLTYYVFTSLGLLLMMSVSADLIGVVAPASYADAAPYVVAVAGAFVSYGLLHALYRICRMPRRRAIYVGALLAAAITFVVSGAVLVPAMGPYGAALAQSVAQLAAAAFMVVAIARSTDPLRFEWSRLIKGVVIALVCFAPSLAATPPSASHAVFAASGAVLFVPLLVLTGAIPRASLAHLWSAVRAATSVSPNRRRLVRRVMELPASQRAAVELIARDRRSLEDASDVLRVPADIVGARLVRGVRAACNMSGHAVSLDYKAARLLLFNGSPYDRDILAEHLITEGFDALELHLLDEAFRELRRGSRRRWRRQPRREPARV
jgi:O-antigen/teichoic acid export membrane protein